MNTLTRKQREIQQREMQILEVSRRMLGDRGYLWLSMDRVAEEMEYSKGTIYQHFKNKEEIILALAIETLKKRQDLFERAASFQGSPRERLSAIGVACELFVRLYPDHFQVEQIIRASSIWEKTSEIRQQVLRTCEASCIGIVGGVVRDAIAHGDLKLPEDMAVEDIVFGLWSISYGGSSIIMTTTPNSLTEVGINDPFLAIRRNIGSMMDGYNWLPLSKDYDYDETVQRVQKEVFSDELQQVVS
ncbi:MAG: TetR family transcriptional regulator [Blastopirellula sp.]|nr:MAG: TetR family transcriptional regulator [Blastopirellula sp.]